VAIVAISFASILIRWSEAPPEVIAFYRMLLATMVLAPFALRSRNRSDLASLDRRTTAIMLAVGAVLAIHFYAFNASLELTSVASATVLVTSHPLLVGVLFLLNERPRSGGLGIVIGLGGVVVISFADLGSGRVEGDLLALVGMVAAAIYLLAGRVVRQRVGLINYVLIVYSSCTAALFLIALVNGSHLWPYPVQELMIFLALAIVSTLMGHTILNWSLRYLPAAFVSVSMLGEPVGASILAALLLAEVPAPAVALGAIMVLAGIALTAGPEKRPGDATPGP
jgi:drug/metabolite transporter (DMT)-like permease